MKSITTKSGTTIDSTVNGELGPKPNIYAVARIADGTERTLEYLQCVTFAVTAQAAIDRARSLHADMRQERLYALPIWSEIGKRLVEMQGMSVTEMIARSALHESRIIADRLKARRRRTRKARKADAERVAVAGPKAPKAPAAVEAPAADLHAEYRNDGDVEGFLARVEARRAANKAAAEAILNPTDEAAGEPAPRKARKPKAEAPAASGAVQVVEHALQEQERRAAAVEAALAAERAERAEANGNPRAAETHRKIEASKRSARARFAADESAALAAKAGELLTAEGEPAAPVRKARRKRA